MEKNSEFSMLPIQGQKKKLIITGTMSNLEEKRQRYWSVQEEVGYEI